MAVVRLNQEAYNQARSIIENGLEVEHDKNWEAVKPTEDEVIHFLDTHSLKDYGRWFLGIDPDADPDDKSKYLYPSGDLKVIHKSALELSEKEAARKGDGDVAAAARKLLTLIEQNKKL
jgi:hypothetical protein